MTKKEISEKISKLEEEIRATPYHKGTEHHIGLLKAKIAKFKRELEEGLTKSGGGGHGVKKQGDATCVLVGPPSVGKSTLLNNITKAFSKAGSYDFTTLKVIPGMMEYKGAKIQIFDLPGLVKGAAIGKGEGKKILSVVRGADLVILMIDVNRISWLKKIKDELYQAGIRLNLQPPRVKVKKLNRGGIKVIDPFVCFPKETIIKVAQEMGLKNSEISFEKAITSLDQLIDAFSDNRIYLSAIEVVNKIDVKKDLKIKKGVLISAKEKIGLDNLKETIWQKLGLIRIYLKGNKKGQPDFKAPLILRKGMTIFEAIKAVSTDLVERVNQVLAWGPGTKFPGQNVPLSYLLEDEMILFFVKK